MPFWQLHNHQQRLPRQTQTQLNLEAGAEDGWLNFRLIVFFPLSADNDSWSVCGLVQWSLAGGVKRGVCGV